MSDIISFSAASKVNSTNFTGWFGNFAAVISPTSTQNEGLRICTVGLSMKHTTGAVGENPGSSAQMHFQAYFDQRAAAGWQYWGNGWGGAFPTTNTVDFSTGSTSTIINVGTGQYLMHWDHIVGTVMTSPLTLETGVATLGAIVSAGNIRINTKTVAGAYSDVSSTAGISFGLMLIGKGI